MLDRRSFLRGAGSLLAAPAIVRVASIMPIFADRFITVPYTAVMDIESSVLRARARAVWIKGWDQYWNPYTEKVILNVHEAKAAGLLPYPPERFPPVAA